MVGDGQRLKLRGHCFGEFKFAQRYSSRDTFRFLFIFNQIASRLARPNFTDQNKVFEYEVIEGQTTF